MEEPAAKRSRLLACVRCRRRKQKCDDERPCQNCMASGAECMASTSIYYQDKDHFHQGEPQSPTRRQSCDAAHLVTLEHRLARLERQYRSVPQNQLPPDHHELDGNNTHEVTQSTNPNSTSINFNHEVAYSNSNGNLSRSTPAIGLLATFAHSPPEDERRLTSAIDGDVSTCQTDERLYELLFDDYRTKIHSRYPFLLLELFMNMPVGSEWAEFFVHMIMSIGLLLRKYPCTIPSQNQQQHYRIAVTQHLSSVFAQPDPILHIQAYLILSMHALHSPSTERICSLASATMRYCVMAQLHLKESEPAVQDVDGQADIQIRRRVFWSAYTLDRAVGTMFDIPFSVADYVITVPMYLNIADEQLLESCQAAFPLEPRSRAEYTSISWALHVVYCRQIQSEILNITQHRDFKTEFDSASSWRLRILDKLELWKSLCHRVSDAASKTYTSATWLHMIYNFSLTMLYRPTRQNVDGPSADWTIKACTQACLIFRQYQRQKAMAETWMGLLQQFKCGVALLYCFFITPLESRTETFSSTEVPEAVRACSVILTLLAEKWPRSECLRDAFDILAAEIPLHETSTLPPMRIKEESRTQLSVLMESLRRIVVHRDTLRMIEEMATEPFPRTRSLPVQDSGHPGTHTTESDNVSSGTGDFFQPLTPQFFTLDTTGLEADITLEQLNFPTSFDFDFDFAI